MGFVSFTPFVELDYERACSISKPANVVANGHCVREHGVAHTYCAAPVGPVHAQRTKGDCAVRMCCTPCDEPYGCAGLTRTRRNVKLMRLRPNIAWSPSASGNTPW